jgi:DNA processing protein
LSDLAIALFAASTDSHLLDEPKSARFDRFRAQFDEPAVLADLERRGVRWIGRSDRAFPARLRKIHDPPAGLFVRGAADLALLDAPCVAVVGARACSAYGAAVAAELARGLARAGVVVVSGLARGIDGAAHRGALDTGTTVAVLGCGVDRDYPRAHRMLAASIAERGLIVSEYPPGVEPAPWRFPARNRIVAGLSDATVVVEARERSGALITADLALDEGRDVLAVPGEITSLLSKGTNHLLRLGAIPVTCLGDVLTVVGVHAPTTITTVLEERLEAVRATIADAPVAADELVRRTGLTAGALAAALAELELAGAVVQSEGLYRVVMPTGGN